MKFPRNARIYRGQLDAAPFAAVFFLLVIFMMLGSLVYTPGARLQLQLPRADGLPGTDRRTVSVAVDADGRLYYENQGMREDALRSRLKDAVKQSDEPLTLVIYADKSVTYETCLRLALLARDAGISEALLATLPRAHAAPGSTSHP